MKQTAELVKKCQERMKSIRDKNYFTLRFGKTKMYSEKPLKQNNMTKTAVEWYANQAMKLETKRQSGKISTEQMVNELIKVLNQANEMFREQMIGFAKNLEHIDINKSDMENELNCYLNLEDTEELLNETFKSE